MGNFKIVEKWVTVSGRRGQEKRRLRVKVYRPTKVPEPRRIVLPSLNIRKGLSTEGLASTQSTFDSLVLDELGPSWWQFGGGGV
jgi:hypothetical protein